MVVCVECDKTDGGKNLGLVTLLKNKDGKTKVIVGGDVYKRQLLTPRVYHQ